MTERLETIRGKRPKRDAEATAKSVCSTRGAEFAAKGFDGAARAIRARRDAQEGGSCTNFGDKEGLPRPCSRRAVEAVSVEGWGSPRARCPRRAARQQGEGDQNGARCRRVRRVAQSIFLVAARFAEIVRHGGTEAGRAVALTAISWAAEQAGIRGVRGPHRGYAPPGIVAPTSKRAPHRISGARMCAFTYRERGVL